MKSLFRLLILVLFFSNICFAGVRIIPDGPTKRFLKETPDQQGCLVGSIGVKTYQSMYYSVSIWIERFDIDKSQASNRIEIFHVKKRKDQEFNDASGVGNVFEVCLPPGNYVIERADLTLGATRYVGKASANLMLSVEPGQTKYIGSFIGYFSNDDGNCDQALGPRTTEGPKKIFFSNAADPKGFSYEDMYERDTAILKKKMLDRQKQYAIPSKALMEIPMNSYFYDCTQTRS